MGKPFTLLAVAVFSLVSLLQLLRLSAGLAAMVWREQRQ
jgi:hypothetical protein